MNKEDLFKKLRANTHEQYDMPDMHIDAIQYPDTFMQFVEMTEKVGGKIVEVKKDDDLDAVIKKQYPEAKTLQAIFLISTLHRRIPIPLLRLRISMVPM